MPKRDLDFFQKERGGDYISDIMEKSDRKSIIEYSGPDLSSSKLLADAKVGGDSIASFFKNLDSRP